MFNKIFFLTIFPFLLFAQQDSFFSLYRFNMNIINPAFAGSEGQNIVSINSRNQWVSIENAPKNQLLILSSPRKNNVGLGFSVISSKFFIEQNTTTYIDFSYKLNFSDETSLFLGLKGGASFYKADISGLGSSNSVLDPAQKAISSFTPNFGIGALLKSANYWISLSIPRLFSSENDLNFISTDRVHSYLAAGFNIELSNDFILKPSFLSRKVKDLPITHELSTHLEFKKLFQVGSFYRTNKTLGAVIFTSYKNIIDIGYAYELPTDNTLSNLSLKNHEIFLRFKFGESIGEEEVSQELSE